MGGCRVKPPNVADQVTMSQSTQSMLPRNQKHECGPNNLVVENRPAAPGFFFRVILSVCDRSDS